MHFSTVQFSGPRGYLLPLGDIHWGDKAFKGEGFRKLKGNLDWLKEHEEEAKGLIMGDLFNLAGRNEKASPFESDPKEVKEAAHFFKPYAPYLVGALPGNHEHHVERDFGFNPLEMFCEFVGIPFFDPSVLLRIQVGQRPENNWYWNSYSVFAHHTKGSGRTIGAALESVKKLEEVIQGCDAYLGAHTHRLAEATRDVYVATTGGPKMRKVHYVCTGGYLAYEGSYAEDWGVSPTHMGSPRLRFSGERDHHDCHVSL